MKSSLLAAAGAAILLSLPGPASAQPAPDDHARLARTILEEIVGINREEIKRMECWLVSQRVAARRTHA